MAAPKATNDAAPLAPSSKVFIPVYKKRFLDIVKENGTVGDLKQCYERLYHSDNAREVAVILETQDRVMSNAKEDAYQTLRYIAEHPNSDAMQWLFRNPYAGFTLALQGLQITQLIIDCCWYGNLEMLQKIVSYSYSPSFPTTRFQDGGVQNCASIAILKGHTEILKFLISIKKVWSPNVEHHPYYDKQKKTALHHAMEKDNLDAVRLLFEYINSNDGALFLQQFTPPENISERIRFFVELKSWETKHDRAAKIIDKNNALIKFSVVMNRFLSHEKDFFSAEQLHKTILLSETYEAQLVRENMYDLEEQIKAGSLPAGIRLADHNFYSKNEEKQKEALSLYLNAMPLYSQYTHRDVPGKTVAEKIAELEKKLEGKIVKTASPEIKQKGEPAASEKQMVLLPSPSAPPAHILPDAAPAIIAAAPAEVSPSAKENIPASAPPAENKIDIIQTVRDSFQRMMSEKQYDAARELLKSLSDFEREAHQQLAAKTAEPQVMTRWMFWEKDVCQRQPEVEQKHSVPRLGLNEEA